MLAVNSYTKDYVDDCRARVESLLAAYRDLAKSVPKTRGAALEAFEVAFFNEQVILLDAYFVHRTRALEGKDGNPLNEVRLLANSMLGNGGVMAADRTIRLDPATSVLGYHVGDTIELREPAFVRLSDAFFEELRNRYL